MKLKKLFYLEFLKNSNRQAYTILILSLYFFYVNIGNPTVFKYAASSNSFYNFNAFSYYIGLMSLLLMFAIFNALSITRDLNNKVFIKHICDGMKKNEYLIGKLIWMISSMVIYFVIFFLVMLFVTLFYSFSIEKFLLVFSYQVLIPVFVGLIFYGFFGILYSIIFKNSLLAILVLIAHNLIEGTVKVIEYKFFSSEYCKFLPLSSFQYIIRTPNFNILFIGVIIFYLIILYVLIKNLIQKIN